MKSNHSHWLNVAEVVILSKYATTSQTASTTDQSYDQCRTGGPLKRFVDCSEYSKRKRLTQLGKVDISPKMIVKPSVTKCFL